MISFQCQQSAIDTLSSVIASDRHSIIIEGPQGCGKTYLANYVAKQLGDIDFVKVLPTVADIRKFVYETSLISNRTVVCIENLDDGVVSAAYTLLKVLEEPQPHIYLVVTCKNIADVPATIISRSVVVSAAGPTPNDLISYTEKFSAEKRQKLINSKLWRACKSFQDIEMLFTLSADKLEYLSSFSCNVKNDTISTLMWNIGHYPDNTETPANFIIRVLLLQAHSIEERVVILDAIKDMSSRRIASHAVIAKMLLTLKYAT